MKLTDFRKSLLDGSPKDNIKRDVLSKFKEHNSDVGHTLPPNWLIRYAMSLNPKEKNFIDEAIAELIAEGYVEKKKDNLALTAKGVEHIY